MKSRYSSRPPRPKTELLADELELVLSPDEYDDPEALRGGVADRLRCAVEQVPPFQVRRRSIDARRGRVDFRILVRLGERAPEPGNEPLRQVESAGRAIIVGAGPAGLFCAYRLAQRGVRVIIVERGKKVQPRRRDLKQLNVRGVVNPECNYCFGEGGAGTYSDGKLYTRSQKRGNVREVLNILVGHGAPEDILVDARPHIGSNLLPKVVTALREHLESVGVEFRFDTRVVDLLLEGRPRPRAVGVRLWDESELCGDAVVLATGHSARDVYEMLHKKGVALEAKPFAVGVRIEHPQPLINRIQYGDSWQHPKLPAAYYRCASNIGGRGVYSFCMCPGGFVVPASTEVDGVVLNGMSLSKRNSKYANSGLVVTVTPEDLGRAGYDPVVGGIDFQRKLESAAFAAGGGALKAPATRVTDFMAQRGSDEVPASSYLPKTTPADVAQVLDAGGVGLVRALREALGHFDHKMRGYVSEEAVLLAVESRSSSPVRILRDGKSLESPSAVGLYPCAEGAGYAGGIVSAALDGMRVADRITRQLA